MVTREQIEEALDDESKNSFITKDIDYDVKVITLLRERIPYNECPSIIGGARHDVIYLCNIDKALPYLTEEDLAVLADCNCWLDEDNDCIALYV